jgi:hypothetical protein
MFSGELMINRSVKIPNGCLVVVVVVVQLQAVRVVVEVREVAVRAVEEVGEVEVREVEEVWLKEVGEVGVREVGEVGVEVKGALVWVEIREVVQVGAQNGEEIKVVVVITAGVRNGEVVKVMAEVEAATGALNGEVGVEEITGVAIGEGVGPKHHKSTKISHELRKNRSVYGKNFLISRFSWLL